MAVGCRKPWLSDFRNGASGPRIHLSLVSVGKEVVQDVGGTDQSGPQCSENLWASFFFSVAVVVVVVVVLRDGGCAGFGEKRRKNGKKGEKKRKKGEKKRPVYHIQEISCTVNS